MNKKLLAIAIAGVLAAPLAQAQTANVVLYGRINIDMEVIINQKQDAAPFNKQNIYRVSSNSSRFGMRGTESLGGGLNAIFQIESSIVADNSGGTLAGRETFAGLQGGWGTVKLGYYSLLFVAFPGLVLTKIGATAIWSKESSHSFIGAAFPHTDDPRWIMIGGTALDGGAGLLVLALILGWFGVRRMSGGDSDFLTKVPVVKSMRGETLVRATTIISVVLLVGYALAIWVMSTKPS